MARRTKAQIELDRAEELRRDEERRIADERRKAEREKRQAEAEQRQAFDARWAELYDQINDLWEGSNPGTHERGTLRDGIEQITGSNLHDDLAACKDTLDGHYWIVDMNDPDPLGKLLDDSGKNLDDDTCKTIARECAASTTSLECLTSWLELYGMELSRKRAA